jgi:hypothetical protein
MTHYEPTQIESADLPDTVTVLGVDGEGQTHYATSPVGGVTVYVGGEDGLQAFDLAETPVDGLEGWIDHVGSQRGWNRLNYSADGFDAHLADRLAAELEA